MKNYFKCPSEAKDREQSLVRNGVRRYYDIIQLETEEVKGVDVVVDQAQEAALIAAGWYPTLTEALEAEDKPAKKDK